ncbi:MAG TPA: coenzyme F420-0:L-glutamate ligase [Candidatus Deferrimicrobium sp.]|nr:coenzyme F420-0:L-glutamate ligase [Candidatus Deferrimicrobium sp.]
MIQIIGLENIPIIKENDNLVEIILNSLEQMKLKLETYDIFIIAQAIISRIEGRLRDLNSVKPTEAAIEISKTINRDPHLVTLILEESKKVLRIAKIEGLGKIIVETNFGFVCADAGIDSSNSPNNMVTLLPLDPDKSAAEIRAQIFRKTGKDVAIIITDTHGRAFRNGAINVAIGVAGIKEILDYRGKVDLFGYQLQKTQIAIVDELASAAELIMGEADEGMPIILIRGYQYENKDGSAKGLIRPADQDLFR